MPGHKVRWGILGVAGIAVKRVIPAMQAGERCEIAAIASRDLRKAEEAARSLGIPRAFGSYEALLADRQIEAIYNPLPTHLHVPWSIRAAEAGKHVLCEKPLSMNAAEARQLIDARDRAGVKIGEGFMVRTHPRWLRVRELVRAGRVGNLRVISASMAYFNRDPANVRNVPASGGGALLDIGCYAVTLSRFIFEQEPTRVMALIERDPEMRVFLRRISPLTNAERISRPLLIVHGKNDPRVPLSEAEQIVNRVRAKGGEVWYLQAADEGHGFRKKQNRDAYYRAFAQFLITLSN